MMKLKLPNLSFRDLLNIVTLGVLVHGALELKNFLTVNFVENDTPIKRRVNKALNGELTFPEKSKKPEELKKPEKESSLE